jgi:endonuclease/exonuclease/phosphatase family metal-dependent hydrolase
MVSTHFWYKAAAEEDFLQRLENVKQLKARCDALYAAFGVPIIVSGDLNNGKGASQGEAPYFAMVEQGFVDIRHKAADTTDSFTIHHYPLQGADGLYFCTEMPSKTLDYIFTYGEHLKALKFAVVTSDIALRSSDHCPLIGDFEFCFHKIGRIPVWNLPILHRNSAFTIPTAF